MRDLLFRCSAIGKLMTEPKTKAEGVLSTGAKTHIRELAAQEIFGVTFEVSTRPMQKGIECEDEAIAMLGRVRGLELVKNTERRKNEWIMGEADVVTPSRGYDTKCSWSVATFPICEADCVDKLYEWQVRGYMWLWDTPAWEVVYALVSTPEHLAQYELPSMHFVDHIPEAHRITGWTILRDADKESAMIEKIKAARIYYAEVVAEFDRTHSQSLEIKA